MATGTTKDRLLHLLLIEDDEIDVISVRRCLHDIGAAVTLKEVSSGAQAFEALRENPRLPWLILLDLNMPRMSGLEFLRTLRADPALRHLPVVVMTTSTDERDVRAAFGHHVAGYFVKPLNDGRFRDIFSAIERYWHASEVP